MSEQPFIDECVNQLCSLTVTVADLKESRDLWRLWAVITWVLIGLYAIAGWM